MKFLFKTYKGIAEYLIFEKTSGNNGTLTCIMGPSRLISCVVVWGNP